LIIIHHLSIYIKDTILLKVFTIVGAIGNKTQTIESFIN